MPSLSHGYVQVGPLSMYHDIEGEGPPLVLLHGGLTTAAGTFHVVRPALALHFRTVAIEQQGHGHTPDIDREMSFTRMADDTAEALRRIGVDWAAVLGYSDGGNVALGLAVRHPDLVDLLVIAGTNTNNDGLVPGVLDYYPQAKPEDMEPLAAELDAVAPVKGQFPVVLGKVMRMCMTFPGWTEAALRGITVPTLVVAGDRDIVRPDHAVATFQLIWDSQLAILPDAPHETLMETPGLDDLLIRFLVGIDGDPS